MIQIDMEMPKDCRMCPFMATDGIDTLAPMMCVVIWGKNHEKKHCIQGKVRDDEPLCDLTYEYIRQFDKRQDDCPLVEAIPKADYENRLKTDMVAMLTDIQLEIREYHEIGCDEDCNNCRMVGCIEPVNVIKDLDIIQQKINALKGEQA